MLIEVVWLADRRVRTAHDVEVVELRLESPLPQACLGGEGWVRG